METDPGANQYQLATAADKDKSCLRRNSIDVSQSSENFFLLNFVFRR